MRYGAALAAVEHSEGTGAEEQVVEEGAMMRRIERAVGSVDVRGTREEERGVVWKERLGDGRAPVAREKRRGRK